MNYKYKCPICEETRELNSFIWSNYEIINCSNCKLDYCQEMIEKEQGGDSSPVHSEGIDMMADVFLKTEKLALIYAKKRKKIYENLLGRELNKVLEVGCGPGVFFEPWNSLDIDWKGNDINPFWIEFGYKNNIPIKNESLNSINEKFDVIMAHQVIEHVENPILFMKNIKSLLKPNGIIHLELPNQNSLTSRIRQISSNISYDYGFIQPPMHLRAFRKETIKYLFNELDLESKLIFTCGNANKTWGQARDYNFKQKIIYKLAGKIGMGSLLIGLGQLSLSRDS